MSEERTVDEHAGARAASESLTRTSDKSNDKIMESLSVVEVERRQLYRQLEDAAPLVIANGLKARINALAPAYRVPPEILSDIFWVMETPAGNAMLYGDGPPRRPNRAEAFGWLNVTHVCHRWRCIAIENPILWNDVTFALGSSWADRMLLRSKEMPVFINATLEWGSLGVDSVECIARHLHHTKDLFLSADCDTIKAWLGILVTPAPILQVLHLVDTCEPIAYPENIAWAPANLFDGHAPLLGDVTLTNVFIPWSSASTLFRNTLGLDLNCNYDCPDEDQYWLPTVTEFLNVLECTYGLQSLTIEKCLPSANAQMVATGSNLNSQFVTLRHIDYLELTGEIADVELALSCLRTPSNEHLILEAYADELNQEVDAHNFFLTLHNHLSSQREALVSVNDFLIWPDTPGLQISCDMQTGESTKLEVKIVFYRDFTLSILLKHFFMQLPFGPIRTIRIGHFTRVSEWQEALRKPGAQTVESLSIEGGSFKQLLRCLCMDINQDGKSTLTLPNLHSLDIFGYTFTDDSWTLFLETLQSRKTGGSPIRRLALHKCAAVGDDRTCALVSLVDEVLFTDEECRLSTEVDVDFPCL